MAPHLPQRFSSPLGLPLPLPPVGGLTPPLPAPEPPMAAMGPARRAMARPASAGREKSHRQKSGGRSARRENVSELALTGTGARGRQHTAHVWSRMPAGMGIRLMRREVSGATRAARAPVENHIAARAFTLCPGQFRLTCESCAGGRAHWQRHHESARRLEPGGHAAQVQLGHVGVWCALCEKACIAWIRARSMSATVK